MPTETGFQQKDRRKAVDYVALVLSGPLWDFYSELYDKKGAVLVVEDSASVHTAKVSKEWRCMNSMETLAHPAYSPDLNPIEHVWKHLKVAINERPVRPKTVEEAEVALLEEWAKIDVDFINQLAESMSRRVQAVIEVKGHHTKY